jgi:hypothetical protein
VREMRRTGGEGDTVSGAKTPAGGGRNADMRQAVGLHFILGKAFSGRCPRLV